MNTEIVITEKDERLDFQTPELLEDPEECRTVMVAGRGLQIPVNNNGYCSRDNSIGCIGC